jgi:hypothetical protein
MQVMHDKKLECIPTLITCLSNVPKAAIVEHQATVTHTDSQALQPHNNLIPYTLYLIGSSNIYTSAL